MLMLLATSFGASSSQTSALLPAASERRTSAASPLFLMHYHKTGHEVTKDLVKLFAEQPTAVTIYYNNSVNGRFLENERASDDRVSDETLGCEPHNFTKHPLRAREAPDMFCDELKAFVPSDLNVVHFLREPADMIVSAYLYHKQEPPPEHWMNRTDPCERDEPMLRLMAKTIGIDYSAVEVRQPTWTVEHDSSSAATATSSSSVLCISHRLWRVDASASSPSPAPTITMMRSLPSPLSKACVSRPHAPLCHRAYPRGRTCCACPRMYCV